MNEGSGLAYKDQEAAERAVSDWRWRYTEAIVALKALNERIDSKSLDDQIRRMEVELNR